jgi:hypothetical protein
MTSRILEEYNRDKEPIHSPKRIWKDRKKTIAEPQKPTESVVVKEKQSLRPWTQTRKFVKFPRSMIADKRLSPGAKALALVLEAFDIRHGGKAFPGLARLGEAMNRSRPVVERLLDELEGNDYIQRERRYGKPTNYTMTLPLIDSIEEMIEHYQLFGIHLTDEDFWDVVTFDKRELSIFFGILKRFRKEWDVKGRRSSTKLEKMILQEWAKVKISLP